MTPGDGWVPFGARAAGPRSLPAETSRVGFGSAPERPGAARASWSGRNGRHGGRSAAARRFRWSARWTKRPPSRDEEAESALPPPFALRRGPSGGSATGAEDPAVTCSTTRTAGAGSRGWVRGAPPAPLRRRRRRAASAPSSASDARPETATSSGGPSASEPRPWWPLPSARAGRRRLRGFRRCPPGEPSARHSVRAPVRSGARSARQ